MRSQLGKESREEDASESQSAKAPDFPWEEFRGGLEERLMNIFFKECAFPA